MRQKGSTRYLLRPTPGNVHFGFYSAGLKPILHIDSGDTVRIETTLSDVVEGMKASERSEILALSEKKKEGGPGPHFLVGPVYISGAEPGYVLEVRIEEVSLRSKHGLNRQTASGTLSRRFPVQRLDFNCLGRMNRVARNIFPGVTIPLRPFFGSLAVAPPPAYGRVSSKPPGIHGGNLDVKELGAGATVYLPVHVPGALFSCGDGHAAQGDGEADGTALETLLTGVFKFIVRRDLHLKRPMAETPTHYMTIAFHNNLKSAARMAVEDMVSFLAARKDLTPENAYSLVSMVGEMHVSQMVNGRAGIHFMVPKGIFT